jgi:hypothetical protein
MRVKPVSRAGEQSAPGSDIEKCRPTERFDSKKAPQGGYRLLDLLVVDEPQKVAPVLSELESLSARDFKRVLVDMGCRGDLTGHASPMN